jgi:hypothetical protein
MPPPLLQLSKGIMAIESLFLILEKKEEEAAAQIEKMCYHN